ncbi:MAG: alpha/beta hydrolase [Candidatus Marsarchaeota archaeon]|nr:alpha/beta hydrolase [Candidatus Marsarchaeota archaeon]
MDYDLDFEDRKTTTALGVLHYRHHEGTGPTIVFLHGMGGSARVWKRLVGYLPKNLNVYLIDLLGHGQSDAPKLEYTIGVQITALLELFAEQNLSDIYLFGNSYGGWIALQYASQYDLKGLILEDPAGLKFTFDKVKATGKEQVDELRDKLFKLAMKLDNKDYVIRSILGLEFEHDPITDSIMENITAKTLIIWGGDDPLIDVADGEYAHRKIKNSKLVVIDGGGHESHYFKPGDVAAQILDFIG